MSDREPISDKRFFASLLFFVIMVILVLGFIDRWVTGG